MSPLLVFCTFPDRETALRIARACVEERLAACGNALPGVTSVYRWEGEIRTGAEVLVLFKTTAEAYPRLETRLRELHPYEVPEILATPLSGGLPEYLQWVAEGCAP